MARKKKNKKKLEFSKIIFLCTSILFTLVVIGSFVLMWHVGDTSALVRLISATSSLLTITVGYYMWKSKCENLLKIRKSYNLTMQELQSLANTDSNNFEDTHYNEDM